MISEHFALWYKRLFPQRLASGTASLAMLEYLADPFFALEDPVEQ